MEKRYSKFMVYSGVNSPHKNWSPLYELPLPPSCSLLPLK